MTITPMRLRRKLWSLLSDALFGSSIRTDEGESAPVSGVLWIEW